MSSLDYLELCRLCLVKDNVSVPIFEEEGDLRQIYFKISSCLPVKVSREDKLPKKICDECGYKVELLYQFWNTTANAEKQLLQWLGEVGIEDKQGYVTEVLDSSVMKQERSSDNRLDGSVMQVGDHQNNIDINMIDNISIITMPAVSEQQFTTVPMDTSGTVQTVQAVPGPSTQTTHDQIVQSQTHATEVEEESEEENYDDGCDNEGMTVKEETEDHNEQPLDSTFVNVTLPCDEAGPSGLHQQKISELTEITSQTADGDPKTGYYVTKLEMLPQGIVENELTENALLLGTVSLDVKTSSDELMVVPPDALFQCTLCGEPFVDEANLDYHYKTKHEDQLQQQPQQHQEEIVTDETAVTMYACECCSRIFPDELSYREHQQLEHQQQHSQEEVVVVATAAAAASSIEESHQPRIVAKELHVCEVCGFSSLERQELLDHQLRANHEAKYHCEACGTGFYAQETYQAHMLAEHSTEKPFQCEICQATFRYRQGLRLHAKLHEPDYVPPQKKHRCEICNKRFCRKQVLLVHMRTHGGAAAAQHQHVCQVCGKSVSSKTYLTIHVRKHTGEKPHVCDICNKAFISPNYLSVHRRTHTGERPHKCNHCHKTFTQRTTMIVHSRSHTGDRPYPCTHCYKKFASKTMLNSHLKTHAKQNDRTQPDEEPSPQPPPLVFLLPTSELETSEQVHDPQQQQVGVTEGDCVAALQT